MVMKNKIVGKEIHNDTNVEALVIYSLWNFFFGFTVT